MGCLGRSGHMALFPTSYYDATIEAKHEGCLFFFCLWEFVFYAFVLLLIFRIDMLILGLGEHAMPLSPETKRHINALGIRVEIQDTRNAAGQFNLLATERGVEDVAAAMIPIGWNARK